MASRPRPLALRVLMPALLALSGALACSPGSEPSERQSGDARPERVVLIVADTLRRDFVSPYVDVPPVPTPNLHLLAERGTVFTNAISSFHQTSMSMSAIFTGLTPSIETGDPAQVLPWTRSAWCGMARHARADDERCIPEHLDTLAEDMQRAGFETLGVVSNRLLFRPLGYEQGFDQWLEVGEAQKPKSKRSRRIESRTRAGDRVNAQVFGALDARESDRFFLYVHYIDPHEYGVRADLPRYEDGVRALDTAVGELIAGLAERGLAEGSVFVFTSDHGERLARGSGGHALEATPKHFGNPSFESLLRVPLIVTPAIDRHSDALVRGQDLRGLIGELAGLPPRTTDSNELAPDEVFLTEQFYQTYRRGRFKSMWSRSGQQTALFDLESDPGETQDVAEAHPELLSTHRARVAELTRALGSLHGRDATLSDDDAERLRALGYLGDELGEGLEDGLSDRPN